MMIRTQLFRATRAPLTTFTQKQFARFVTTKYANQEQLYLHDVDSTPNAHTVSFCKDPSKMAIGRAYLSSETDDIRPENFELNKEFVDLLHSVVSKNAIDDFTYLVESTEYAGEHMPIYDLRKVPEYQRTPDIEDIYGFVRCDEKGGVIPDSYQSNNLYSVVSLNGPLMLSEHLHEKLLQELGEEVE